MKQLKIHKCGDCGTRIVIMDTETGSILPVEVFNSEPIDPDEIYDCKKHISHLKNCEKLRARWPQFKKDFLKMRMDKFALSPKELLR